MEKATQSRVRADIEKYEAMLEQRKSGRWKSGTMKDGRLVDTNAEDTEELERTIASMKDQITDPED
jgi:hypothetical protein